MDLHLERTFVKVRDSSLHCVTLRNVAGSKSLTKKLSVFSSQFSVFSYKFSVFSFQLSVVSFQLSVGFCDDLNDLAFNDQKGFANFINLRLYM